MKSKLKNLNKKRIILSLFAFIFLVCAGSVYAGMTVYLSDQGTDVKDSSGTTLSSGDLSVRIYDAATGGNLIFEQNFSGGIVDGAWNVMLNKSLNLSLNKKYWKDYYINGDDLDFGGQERLAFYSPLGDILYNNYEANLTVNGSVGIGTTTPTHKLNVVGDANITGNITYNAIYAQLSDLGDQTFAVADTGYPVNLSTTDEIFGLINNNHNVSIVHTGVYSIAAQPQVATGAGGAGKFHMWMQKYTGGAWTNVSNSNVELVLANDEENVIPLIVTLNLNANEKIRIMASVSDTAIILDAQSPATEPDIPSIIFTMFKVGN